mmetsp:Transcript_3175/g.3519  ORF Transcript_3175/g.3519 Transcript_3175/m.3519 type:complete len:274 (+) Transcript_3175:90-911(+)
MLRYTLCVLLFAVLISALDNSDIISNNGTQWLTHFPEPVIKYFDYAVTGVLALFGLIYLVAGYRLFRITLFTNGFLLMFFVSLVAFGSHVSIPWYLTLLISGAIGMIFGLILLFIVYVGIFFSGVTFGFVLGALLLTTPIGTKYLTRTLYQYILVGGAGLSFGVIALLLQKIILIIATSMLGAYSIAIALDIIWLKTHFMKMLPLLILYEELPDGTHYTWKVLLLLCGTPALMIFGVLFQFFFTGRKYDHRKKKRYDSDDDVFGPTPYKYDPL